MASSQVLNKPCVLVIVVASVERFAYKGVSSNLVTYLTGGNVRMSASAAAKAVSGWNGVTSMLPLISSVLVDAYWDRYSTITSFSLLYIGGLAGLTLWAVLDKWMPIYTLFFPLYLISIGQSGYNPSLQAFGADQLENELILCCKEEEKGMKKSSFFHWWYIGICIGSLLGNSTMSYIQDNFGWGIGFSIPMIAMTISVAFFSSGSHFYVHREKGVKRKQLGDVLKLAKESILKLIPPKISLLSPNNELAELELQEKEVQNHYDDSETLGLLPSKKASGIANVILKLLPIWIMLLMFAVIFQQPATFFTSQGMVMKHCIGRSIVIPPAMLQSAITISIVMLMPLYDKLILPLSRLITRDDKGITVLQRIGIGMFLSIVAMVVAALVETKRLEISREGSLEEPSSMMKQMSIFWLLPQCILLGVSDIFTVVGMQEFFYSSVPKTMRTVGIGLYLSVFGVGSFISALLISIVEIITGSFGKEYSWFSNNMSEAKLYKYYWFLALLASLSLLMFAFLCKYNVDETTADVATDNLK